MTSVDWPIPGPCQLKFLYKALRCLSCPPTPLTSSCHVTRDVWFAEFSGHFSISHLVKQLSTPPWNALVAGLWGCSLAWFSSHFGGTPLLYKGWWLLNTVSRFLYPTANSTSPFWSPYQFKCDISNVLCLLLIFVPKSAPPRGFLHLPTCSG